LNALLELARLLKPNLVFDWFHRALADGSCAVPLEIPMSRTY
jgi:hypothetical protein